MTSDKSCIAFVSTNVGWGGSEELWSQTALRLARRGTSVAASISLGFSPPDVVAAMVRAKVRLQQRQTAKTFMARAWQKLSQARDPRPSYVVDIDKFLRFIRPGLVVLSEGLVLPPVELMELCVEKRWPFAFVGHANFPHWWPDDATIERLRNVLPLARRCFFVSKSNQSLVETHVGVTLSNAEIVRNPFNVAFAAAPPWPKLGNEDELHLACVARLDPTWKGQDILFEALSAPSWSGRRWRLTLYGDGPSRKALIALCERLGLSNRIMFAGHIQNVEQVWSQNHVLIVPSRWEALPLVIVEAMLCGRPVVATNVGGIGEIIEHGATGFLADVATADGLRSALEQMWIRRAELERMGKVASDRIRSLVPADPVEAFAKTLQQLISFAETVSPQQ